MLVRWFGEKSRNPPTPQGALLVRTFALRALRARLSLRVVLRILRLRRRVSSTALRGQMGALCAPYSLSPARSCRGRWLSCFSRAAASR